MRRIVSLVMALLLPITGLVISPWAAHVAADVEITMGATTLISASPTGDPANAQIDINVMSTNARFVAFVSAANNLLPAETLLTDQNGNIIEQTYVYDRQTHVMSIASRANDGSLANEGGHPLGVSDDGRFVLFASSSTNLVANYPPPCGCGQGLFIRDVQAGTTTMVNASSEIVDAQFGWDSMSADGNIVVYSLLTIPSNGSLVTPGGTYMYNRTTGVRTQLSSDPQRLPVIASHSGQFVLYPASGGVVKYDVNTGDRQSISAPSLGQFGPGALSADDSKLAFYTLSPGAVNILNLSTGVTTTPASNISVAGTPGSLSLSRDGRYVAFFCRINNLFHGGTSWIVDTQTGQRSPIDNLTWQENNVQLSADASEVIYSPYPPNGQGPNQLVVTSLTGAYQAPTTPPPGTLGVTSTQLITQSSTGGPSGPAFTDASNLSGDGRYVAFESSATNLSASPSTTGSTVHMYVYDRTTGKLELEDVSSSGTAADMNSTTGGMSGDGRYVIFNSAADNLSPDYVNRLTSPAKSSYAYIHDRQTGSTTLIDPLGLASVSIGSQHQISDDASVMLLSGTDTTGHTQLYLYNRVTGSASAVLSNVAPSGDPVALSPDGRYITYTATQPDRLVEGFMYDTTTGATTDLNMRGTAYFSADDTYVAYANSGSPYPDNTDVYVRNMLTGHTTMVRDGLHTTESVGLTFSANDRYLAGVILRSDVTSGLLEDELHVIDLQTGQDLLVDNGLHHSVSFGFSADGAAISYASITTLGSGQPEIYLAQLGQVDHTPPIVTGTPDRAANANGWYNGDVTINWNATDDSGTATQPSPTTASTEGSNVLYTSDQSCDPSNNCATGNLFLSIDKTAPTITYTVSPAPNAQGWNNGSVVVTFNCSDALSGIDTCTAPVTVSAEGANQTVVGTATDKAGNTAMVSANISLDKTAPVITASLSTTPNAAGWSNAPVTVSYACSDALSGVAFCAPPQTESTDGIYSMQGTATDNAGNVGIVNTVVKLDQTAPTVGVAAWSANPLAAGQSTTLTIPVNDNLSGVAGGEYFIGTDPGVGNGTPMTLAGANLSATLGSNLQVGVYTIGYRAQDVAGNWSPTTTTMLVVYDPTSTLGMTGKNKKDLVPSLSAGDIMPGLVSNTQTDAADYGFTVQYKNNVLDPQNKFMFIYNTGTNCGKQNAQNCHAFSLNANNFAWLIVDQTNNSRGRFEGVAAITVDGVTTTNPFTTEGIDGNRLNPATSDHLLLRVYAPGSDPLTAPPIYQASGNMAKGNSVKIQ